MFRRRLSYEHAAVAAIALYLCQAQTYVLFLVKKQTLMQDSANDSAWQYNIIFFWGGGRDEKDGPGNAQKSQNEGMIEEEITDQEI